MTRQSQTRSARAGISSAAFHEPFRDPPLGHSPFGKTGIAKTTGVKSLPQTYGFSRPSRQSGSCSRKHGEVSSRRPRTKIRHARPLPGCPGRAPAPARPAGASRGVRVCVCISARRGAGGRPGRPAGRRQARPRRGPVRASPKPTNHRRGPPARRPAPPGPRSHRPWLGPAPAPGMPPTPGSPLPLERPSPPAGRGRASRTEHGEAAEPEAPGTTQLPRC